MFVSFVWSDWRVLQWFRLTLKFEVMKYTVYIPCVLLGWWFATCSINAYHPLYYDSCHSNLLSLRFIRWGADMSLARPTSQCRRMESLVLLERGVCSCAELQVFSCYRGWKETCQVTCVISTTSRHELSLIPPLQGKARHQRKFMPFWEKHQGNMHHCMPLTKTGWTSLNMVIFTPVLLLVLDNPKHDHPRELILEDRRISAKSCNPEETGLPGLPILWIWPCRTTACSLDWKNNWKVAIFCPMRRSLLPRRPGWMDNVLDFFWVAFKT